MRWPGQTRRSSQRLHLRALGDRLAFVLTDAPPADDRPPQLLRWGWLPPDKPVACGEALALLDLADYQILKVDTPPVPPEELKAAARWQIKELVDVDAAALTLDVMHVGGELARPGNTATRQLFVVAARSQAIAALSTRTAALTPHLSTVDIWETALRNLLAAQARSDGLRERACAAVLIGDTFSLLVICAQDELFYTRRFEPDAGLLARARGSVAEVSTGEMPLGFEYQPGGSFDNIGTQESPLVVELQRSIDVWERSWPDLPLARLYVVGAELGADVATLIQRELGQRTVAIEPLSHFAPGAPAPEGPDALAACLPLLGAALRVERKEL